MAKLSRQHNNANVLVLGGRILNVKLAMNIVDVFINSEFEFGRHELRLKKLENNG